MCRIFIGEYSKSLDDSKLELRSRYSAFVPVVHMSHGNFGFQGHVVCFMQESDELCAKMPRTTVESVYVNRTGQDRDGNSRTEVFKVSSAKY